MGGGGARQTTNDGCGEGRRALRWELISTGYMGSKVTLPRGPAWPLSVRRQGTAQGGGCDGLSAQHGRPWRKESRCLTAGEPGRSKGGRDRLRGPAVYGKETDSPRRVRLGRGAEEERRRKAQSEAGKAAGRAGPCRWDVRWVKNLQSCPGQDRPFGQRGSFAESHRRRTL